MLNIINPVTNMNGGGNSLYTHYVTCYVKNGSDPVYSNLSIVIKSKEGTPINTYPLLTQWLQNNGFTNNKIYPAKGIWNSTLVTGIYVDTSETDEDEKIKCSGALLKNGAFSGVPDETIVRQNNSIYGFFYIEDVVL